MSQGKVIIHVGGPKTGTTAIQTALAENRNQLLSLGFLYPGDGLNHVSSIYPMRKVIGFENWVSDDADKWKRLCLGVQEWDGSVVISGEAMMAIPLDVINEIVESIGQKQVEVLITARSLYELVTSQWQESIKAGDVISLGQYAEELARGPKHATMSSLIYWLVADYVTPIQRWGQVVGLENVVVQCVDATNSDATLREFEQITAIPSGILGSSCRSVVNRSLSYSEAELVRSCNEILLDGAPSNQHYSTLGPEVILEILLKKPRTDDAKIQLPTSYYESIAPFVNTEVERILNSGARIVGDSSLLTRMPQTVGDSRSSQVKVDLDVIRVVLEHCLASAKIM